MISWDKYNYVSVRKKTNNPFGNRLGTEFKTIGDAVDNYKDVNIKSNILFAGNMAKEYGYEPKYADGGLIDINDFDMPVIRSQFEEEEFEFENGGGIYSGTMKTADGNITGKVQYNDFWKTYQVVIDGVVYEEFKNKEEAIENLKNAGFDKMALGGGVSEDIKIKDWYTKEYSSDEMGKELNDDSTFKDLENAIFKGNNVYSVLGVSDSVLRERAFAKLSKINNKEGQWAYNNWLMYSDKMADGGGVEKHTEYERRHLNDFPQKSVIVYDDKNGLYKEKAAKISIDYNKNFGGSFSVGIVVDNKIKVATLQVLPNGEIILIKGEKKNVYAEGGSVEAENKEMVLNNNNQIAHHNEEMNMAVKNAKNVPAWVVAKVNRSATDLSDATHYMEGENKSYADGGGTKSMFNSTKQKMQDRTQQERIDSLIEFVSQSKWSSKPVTVKDNAVIVFSKMYDLEPIRVASIFNKYQGESYADGGGVSNELKGYSVNIFASTTDTERPLNVVSNKYKNIILVTDGIKGDSSTIMSNEPYIKLVKRNLFGKEYLSAEPVNFGVDNKHTMFGGTFIWSSDSRFRNEVSERPIPIHDRVEYADGGGVGKVKLKTNDKIIADDLLKYADLQGISASQKKIGSYYIITLDSPLEIRESMNGKIKSLLFTKMETGGGVSNEIAEIKAKIEKAKKNTIMPENLKKQYIEKYEKQLAALTLDKGTKEDVKGFLEVPKGKTPKIVKVEPKKSKEDELAEFTEKIMIIESDILDNLKISSGGEIKQNDAIQKKYIAALDKKINANMFKGIDVNAVRDILEDENYHTLNNYLGLKGYYGESGKNDYKSYYDRNITKGNKVFLNPSFFGSATKTIEPKKETKEIKKFSNEVLVLNPNYKYKNTINKWLQDNKPESIKYKVAIKLLNEEFNSDEIYELNDKQYDSILRSLEKIGGESKHEMAWRTLNYSTGEAEKWAVDALKEYFIIEKKETKTVEPSKGRTKRAIAQDKKRPAKKAGKRISESGNTYYESRENRSDKSQKTRLEKGGTTIGWKHRKK
jgi:hypothetical protein